MVTINQTVLRRVKRRDRFARWVITLGGVTVIASVIAILLLIVGVTVPLFLPARADRFATASLPKELPADQVLAVGVELDAGEQGGVNSVVAHAVTRDGRAVFLEIPGGAEGQSGGTVRVTSQQPLAPPGAAKGLTIRSCERSAGSAYSLLWSDGSVSLVQVSAKVEIGPQGKRNVKQQAQTVTTVAADKALAPVFALARYRKGDSGGGTTTCVRQTADNRLIVDRQSIAVNELTDEKETKTHREVLASQIPGTIGAVTMSQDGGWLYVGTKDGTLAWWSFSPEGAVTGHDVRPAFRDKRAITSLAMVFGDVSLAVGDSAGGLSTWFEVHGESGRNLRLIHELAGHAALVREIVPSRRNKGLTSLAADGSVHLDHMTSQRHLLSLAAEQPLRTIGCSERGDGLIALDGSGGLTVWNVHNPHPEVSWRTLFGTVLYEGYSQPEYVWQTTGGEDFEPKMSLLPLIFGTLKGTLYAMLLAVPLALFGAIYTSHFTTPGFKRVIKPTVELMAAVPSVVLGFLAALWLAPIVERWILACFAGMVTLPLVFAIFMLVWQLVRKYDWAKRAENGYEFLVIAPVLLAGAGLAAALAGPLENLLFGGNFRLWLFQHLDVRYDPRNCVIIAFGLGFAVIPIIFSIAEDSLSSVPHNLTAASLAMGASRWQTLWRVVLPSASPGIFAAMMIGFGRAVGETMIVLMATGNTPILDFSPFTGMRTLSANIAVEIPEAPVGGTLQRVLFLCAVLLFVLTFLLNTAAELVRTHLRKRYGRF